MKFKASSRISLWIASLFLLAFGLTSSAFAQTTPVFVPGNLVVVVEGCGVYMGTCTNVQNGTGANGSYGDNQAGPITLFQYTPNGTASVSYVSSFVLPQAPSGANIQISGELGSSSEGTLQLSGDGRYLTLMGYGIDAASFNANPTNYGTFLNPKGAANYGALGQTGSLTLANQTLAAPYPAGYTPVPRVLALIDANGNVNTSTVLYNIFDFNNPRSAFTANGSTVYVSGQGSGTDGTGGVFYSPVGSVNNTPTAITGLDTCAVSNCTTPTVSEDTRTVQIYNNTLYISMDSTEGHSNNRSWIGTLGTPPATSMFTPTVFPTGYLNGPNQISGIGNSGGTGKETITTGMNSNGNNLNAGLQINISPSNYFFASPSVLYVADTGAPKNNSNTDAICTTDMGTGSVGDGGLQKWINSKSDGTGTWSLAYTLSNGLNLKLNVTCDPAMTTGATGLYGLAGQVVGTTAYLYATNTNNGDLDPTYLYGITDTLSTTTNPGTTFTLLDTAPADSNFKGVSFAPTIPAGNVDVTSVPSGLTVSTTGSGCPTTTFTTPLLQAWTPGMSCDLSLSTTQAGTTGVEYVFNQWDDSSTTIPRIVSTPTGTATYTASFITEYLVTTLAGTGGTVSTGGFVPAGDYYLATAYPSTGYYFTDFTGSLTSSYNPDAEVVNGPQTITANFVAQVPTRFTVSAKSPEMSGTPFNFTVTVLDQFGNTDTTYTGTVHFSSTDTLATLPGNTTLSGGTGTFSATLNTGGTQTITATDTVSSSITGTSNAIVASSTGAFVGSDKTTQGNWMGVYGKDGYDVANGPEVPANGALSYGTFAVQNASSWTWAQRTSDKRGLETDGQGDRTAATWYSGTTFSFDVNLTDGQQHEVSLYLLDWDSQGRGETVTITDAANPGRTLDTRVIPDSGGDPNATNTTAANFTGGTYLIWNLSGHVTITATRNAGPNGVVAGIFFGGGTTGGSAPGASANNFLTDTGTGGNWLGVYGGDGYDVAQGGVSLPSYDSNFVAPGLNYVWNANPVATTALETGTDGTSSRIAATWYSTTGLSFDVNLADGQPHRLALYAIDWDNQGRAETVKIQDAGSGATLDTESVSGFANGVYLIWTITGHVTITVTPTAGPNAVISGIFWGPAGASTNATGAIWSRSDVSTQGAWMGNYGSNGFSLAGAGQNFLIPATFAVQGSPSPWVWESNPNPPDPKDLQTDNQGHQIAAAWYSTGSSFSLDLNLTDGSSHLVALYVMDWDSRGRKETFQVSDAASGAVFDTRVVPDASTQSTATNFANGTYLIWKVTGHVIIKITSNVGPNAVVSGVFID